MNLEMYGNGMPRHTVLLGAALSCSKKMTQNTVRTTRTALEEKMKGFIMAN